MEDVMKPVDNDGEEDCAKDSDIKMEAVDIDDNDFMDAVSVKL
jgi:hypothetical protein